MKVLLLTAALLFAQADAGVSQMRVKIVVRAIAASNDPAAPAGMDPKLKPIAPSIESFGEEFRFRSYKLIEEHSFDLDWKNAAEVELPGSRPPGPKSRTAAFSRLSTDFVLSASASRYRNQTRRISS